MKISFIIVFMLTAVLLSGCNSKDTPKASLSTHTQAPISSPAPVRNDISIQKPSQKLIPQAPAPKIEKSPEVEKELQYIDNAINSLKDSNLNVIVQ